MARCSYSTTAARVLAGGAVLVAGACTTTMNWRFGHQLGSSELDGQVLGAFSVALDIAKWFALGLAAIAWQTRARFRAAAGLAVWLVAVIYSATAAIGFTALNRDTSMAERKGETERIERTQRDYEEASSQIVTIKANKRWSDTSACSNATATKSVEFCDHFKDLEARISKANLVLSQGQAKEADPQAALISRISGAPQDRVRIGLSVFLALVAEVVSALGLFAVIAPPNATPAVKTVKARKKRKAAPPKRPAPPVHAAENVLPFAAP